MKLCRKRYWQLHKHEGDSAIYAFCSCGFEYNCSKIESLDELTHFKLGFNKFYSYCPNCGKKYRTDKYIADRIYFK